MIPLPPVNPSESHQIPLHIGVDDRSAAYQWWQHQETIKQSKAAHKTARNEDGTVDVDLSVTFDIIW